MSSSASSKSKRKNALGSRSDPGWEHGTEVDGNSKKVKCKYCGVVRAGGVYRLKHHLAGTHNNMEPCLEVPDEVKDEFRALLQSHVELTSRKKRKLNDIGDGDDYFGVPRNNGYNQKTRGAMDSFVTRKGGSQSTLNQKYKKGERDEVCQQIARFFYTSGIPFNVVNNPEFPIMIDMIGKFGIGLKPPSYHEIRVKFLNKEVQNVMKMLDEYKEEWKKSGCTIMSDGWSDRQRRSICNFLVNSPKGTVFLSSIDTSEISKTADNVLEMLDSIVEKVGEENVVQIVTDNAANYKAAGERLMEKRPALFWTPCAAHCIDLMLDDLDKKINIHGVTITKARKITTYIYSRTLLHFWMKEFTKDRELIRPAVTRFATSYLTLRSLNEQKGPLLALFASDKWKSSKFAKSDEGKRVQRIALDTRGFWPGITTCLRAALPLVKVLRMVDSDEKPAMGFIYEAMTRAKDQIKANFNNVEKNYKPVWDIVDERWEAQMHRPLHASAYFLNPQFQYSPDFKSGPDVKMGLYTCLQRMVSDPEERMRIDLQMDAFKNARGLFGLPTAIMTRKKKTPADWWDSYGDDCPELKKFSIRILSLTCSSSGCERNWSAFEMVHTKKRNRLHQQKMNDLVFIMYNLRLQRKKQKQAIIQESIILEDLPSDDEWITEREEPLLPSDGAWLNVLDRATRRSARDATSRTRDDNIHENLNDENVECQEISDDDIEEVAATLVGSNEFDHVDEFDIVSSGRDFDQGDDNDNHQTGMRTTGNNEGDDGLDDGSLGYDL